MPNHCNNRLFCTDASLESVIKQFISKDDADYPFLDFDKIVKMPEELQVTCAFNSQDADLQETYKANLKKYGFENWYDWCVANWGTKWNSYDFDSNDDECSFSTAWAPPLPVIAELAKKTGNTFVLEYIEEGCAFVGRFTASPDGCDDECYNIPDAPQELLDSLGYEPYEEEVEA